MAELSDRYTKQRPKKQPPMLGLPALRAALGVTQAEVARKVAVITGKTFTVGALSGIEQGHRGPSEPTLRALETALGIPTHSLVLAYEPSHVRRPLEEVS